MRQGQDSGTTKTVALSTIEVITLRMSIKVPIMARRCGSQGAEYQRPLLFWVGPRDNAIVAGVDFVIERVKRSRLSHLL